jgi:hypothetical protein
MAGEEASINGCYSGCDGKTAEKICITSLDQGGDEHGSSTRETDQYPESLFQSEL